MSTPALAAATVASPGDVTARIAPASKSSLTITPREPSLPRSCACTTDRESTAGPGAYAGYEAFDIITSGTPSRTACAHGARSASSACREAPTTLVPASVFAVAWPSPGKCFAVAATPADRRPDAKAPPSCATRAGVAPNARLAANDPGRLTSSTGARSTLIPSDER